MLSVKYSARTVTFFKQLIVRKDRGKRKAIYGVCAMVRRAAINRLKIRPGSSKEGSAPHAHTAAGLRVIQFNVTGNTGIIGPIKFPSSRQYNVPLPSIHEFGKTVITLGRIFKIVNFKKRPYMSTTVKVLGSKIPKEFSIQMGEVL